MVQERENEMNFKIGDVVRVGLDGKTIIAKILAERFIGGTLWYNVEVINSVGYVDFGKIHTKWVKKNHILGL
jgi:hypothetical protein